MTKAIRAIVLAAVVMSLIAVAPSAAFAADSTTPSVTSGTTDPPPEPPLPSPPVEPPHTVVNYTVSYYIDKEIDVLPTGEIAPREVKRVEDLSFIANKLKLTTDEIKYSNPDKDVTQLKEGDTLTLPPVHGVVYKVQDGDTLSWIATSFSVDLTAMEQYNNITDPDHISHDNTFIIPGAKLPPIQRPALPVYSAPTSYGAVSTVPTRPVGGAVGNHFYFGFCTWYVANRRPVPWFGDAIQWWPNARAMGYPEGSTPRPGAILVESPNHVAYVESVGNGSFVVSEENWTAWNVVDYRTISMGDRSIVGFIYG